MGRSMSHLLARHQLLIQPVNLTTFKILQEFAQPPRQEQALLIQHSMHGNFIRTGSGQENFMVAFTSTGGQKVAHIDFNDLGGYGFGQATLSEKQALTVVDKAKNVGNWFMVSLAPGADSTSLVVTANA